MDWKNLFDIISTEEKVGFLEELLEKNESVRSQFVTCFKTEPVNDQITTRESLLQLYNEAKSQILQELEALDFVEFDWEDYVPRHSGYIPEYEACEHMAEDMVLEVLSYPREDILSHIRQGKVAEGAMLFAAVYQACVEAHYEENYAFEDTETAFLDFFQPTYDDMLHEIKSVITNHNQILQLFEALLTQYSGFELDLKYFEPLLKTLAQNKESATGVNELMVLYNVKAEVLPQLFLQIHKLMGNREQWLDHARTYFKIDKELAQQLMAFYLEEDRNLFLSVAEEVFEIYEYTFDSYILENLDIKTDGEFYKKVLCRHVESKNDLEGYRILSGILSQEEKEVFYAKIRNKGFLVKILETEKRHDKIFQLLKSDLDAWDFNEIIQPILGIYPNECLLILDKKISGTLEKERGRSSYQRIVSWIKLAQKIPGASEKVKEIIRTCYNYKPNLPALKDEMKSSGLVPGF